MRSFDKTLANQQWHVLRHFPDAKFFCVTEDDEDATKANLLVARMATVKLVKQPEMVLPEGCPETWTPGQPYMHEPYHISVHPHAVLGQLWMLREGWRLYQETKTEDADLIIRIRPDLWFHSFEVPVFFRSNPTGFIDGREGIACTPRFGRFGGVNDRFALLGADAAEHYFTTYDKVPMMIKSDAPLHPETLVATSLRNGLISIQDDMIADFSTLRKSGEMRAPEITAFDIMDYARQR